MKQLLTILSLFSLLYVKAQVVQPDSNYIATVEKQGNIMANLLLKKNYTAFVKYTYPPIVKMMGGEAKMIVTLKKSLKQMEDEGYTMTNLSVEKPTSIIHFGKKLQCVVTQTLEMKIPKGKLINTATLIGNSDDNGKNWTFIDTHGVDLKTLQSTLKGLSNDLVIPAKKEPVFYKD